MSCNNSTRYDMDDDGIAHPHRDGDFVLFTDHRKEIASLKDQNEQLRSALRRVADCVGGSVSDSASHVFHVMVADEVSFAFSALKKELDNLRQQLTNMTYSNASHRETAETWRAAAVGRDELKKELANEKDARELCHGLRLALAKDLEIARAERNRAIFEPRRELESAKWRKRSEREPEDNEPVMWCCVPVCEPYVVTCMCSDDWDESFTHWIPLPEVPKG